EVAQLAAARARRAALARRVGKRGRVADAGLEDLRRGRVRAREDRGLRVVLARGVGGLVPREADAARAARGAPEEEALALVVERDDLVAPRLARVVAVDVRERRAVAVHLVPRDVERAVRIREGLREVVEELLVVLADLAALPRRALVRREARVDAAAVVAERDDVLRRDDGAGRGA